MSARHGGLGAVLCAALTVGAVSCLHVEGQGQSLLSAAGSLTQAPASEAQALRQAMAKHVAALPRYTADFRLRAVGPEGRLRVLGQLLLQRPSDARITLLLPFGAPAWLGVCNSEQLAAWDIPRARVRRAAASRQGLAEMSALGDVGMTPAELVALGWADIEPPADAQLLPLPATAQEPAAYLWRWQDAEGHRRALKVSLGGEAQLLELHNPAGERATIVFFARDALGLPTGLRIQLTPNHASAHGAAQDPTTVAEVHLSDVRPIPPPTANAFVLEERPLP